MIDLLPYQGIDPYHYSEVNITGSGPGWGNTKKAKKAICQQMTLELLNEAFSAKATRQNPWKHHKEPYDTLLSTYS
jgi:hypothetical protein